MSKHFTRRALSSLAAAGVLVAGAAASAATIKTTPSSEEISPQEWRRLQLLAADKSDEIMRAAQTQNGLLGQYAHMQLAYDSNRDRAFQLIFGQYLSWYLTYVGDYDGARAAFSIAQPKQKGDAESPLSGRWQMRSAADYILERTKDRKAVFFNEAHSAPVTRTLTIELLARLREEGFDTFAAETLYASDDKLQARGYPVEGSGFYTNEPLCAEMVRTALRLGYRVVTYESEGGGSGDARERAQARNLYERVFKTHPKARLVVDAGYGHIQEQGQYLGGQSMAEHLRELIAIDPLTVEQTMLVPHHDPAHDHPYYADLVKRLKPDRPLVFIGEDGKPWALRDGYDVSVLFPPEALRRGRPTWLALDGLRRPYAVDGGDICRSDYPCLVEARYADEGADSIPADRALLNVVDESGPTSNRIVSFHGTATSRLFLRPGKYRITAMDGKGRIVGARDVVIGPGGTTP